MVSRGFLDELKFKNDIREVIGSYVPVIRSGKNLKCKCPFHSETDASLVVYPDTQSFYCFGCGAAGDVISFVGKIEGLDYANTVKMLADRAGIEVPQQSKFDEEKQNLKNKIIEINRKTARIYYENLASQGGSEARKYLMNRQLTPEIIAKFGIGYAFPDWDTLSLKLKQEGYTEKDLLVSGVSVKGKNGKVYDRFRGRVIIPIINIRNEIIGFGGRLLSGDGPKYLNSPDTEVFKKSRNLFAIGFARKSKEKSFILCEGYMDVIALHQAEFTNAVATLGTALTKEQAYFISNYREEVKINYDADDAGINATKKAILIFDTLPIKTTVIELPYGKDPDEFIKEHGRERYEKLAENSLYSTDYLLKKEKEKYNLEKENEKILYLRSAVEVLSKLSDIAESEIYGAKVAGELSLQRGLVIDQMNNIRKKQNISGGFEKLEQSIKSSEKENRIPLNIEKAEQELIAICYNYQGDYKEIFENVEVKLFFRKENREILEMLEKNLISGKAVDIDVARSELSENALSRLIYSINTYSKLPLDINHVKEYMKLLGNLQHKKTSKEIGEMEKSDLDEYIESIRNKKAKGN